MSPPGGSTASHHATQSHAAEVYRQDQTRRDALVQCDRCHATATARLDRRGFTSRSIRAVDSLTVAHREWHRVGGRKAAAALREARRQPITWHHEGCFGLLRAYDIGDQS